MIQASGFPDDLSPVPTYYTLYQDDSQCLSVTEMWRLRLNQDLNKQIQNQTTCKRKVSALASKVLDNEKTLNKNFFFYKYTLRTQNNTYLDCKNFPMHKTR